MKTTQEQMNASTVFCPNLDCCARGKIGAGNIVIHERARPRYRGHELWQNVQRVSRDDV
jgi:hypothetical protein